MERIFTFIFILFCGFYCPRTEAQIYQSSITEFALADTLINAFIKKAQLPGLSMAIGKGERIIYAKGFGFADVENKTPMTTDTRLRTASVAKVITATALGKLISQGKLNLDAPIKKYIPYISEKYAHLTSRQLAGHTAGMAHRPAGNGYKKKQFNTIRETVELMDKPLLFEPDTDYKYSTHAYNFLAAVIEGASGKPYNAYMKEQIFDPLHMTNTFPENIKKLSAKDAKLYYVDKGKLKADKLTNDNYKIPGAAYRTTPTDLVKMMYGYFNGYLSEDTLARMFRSNTLIDGTKTNVGVGWRSSYDVFGNKTIEHAGSWRGARTVVVYYPEEELSIAIMINANCPVIIEETAHLIAQIFRTGKSISAAGVNTNQDINVTVRTKDKEEIFPGNFSLNLHGGSLSVKTDGFLKSNPVYYLGEDLHYALVSMHGLLYLNLGDTSGFKGELYLYHTMNASNPLDEKPFVSFQVTK